MFTLAYRGFKKNKSMVNLANVLLVSFLLLTLLNRLICLFYTLVFDCNQDIPRDTIQMWLYFELPYALINAASIVIFFEWTQIAAFIKSSIMSVENESGSASRKSIGINKNNHSLRNSFIAKANAA